MPRVRLAPVLRRLRQAQGEPAPGPSLPSNLPAARDPLPRVHRPAARVRPQPGDVNLDCPKAVAAAVGALKGLDRDQLSAYLRWHTVNRRAARRLRPALPWPRPRPACLRLLRLVTTRLTRPAAVRGVSGGSAAWRSTCPSRS